ncbi:MAG: helix-turn-helix transcriptional regulator [Myxococcales bacterium]|nr:helix-turn-helix transcriptional regulator [Myxococcales bacterium]
MRRLNSKKSAAIALVEAAYSLLADEAAWLEGVLEAALPVTGNAVFASGMIYSRPPGARSARVQTWKHVGARDHMKRAAREYARKVPTDLERIWLGAGTANTVSQISPESRQLCQSFAAKTGLAADALLLNALDPDGRGASVAMWLPVETELKRDERERWRQLGAHLTAGHRVRRAVASLNSDSTALPCGAEAVVDPTTFHVVDAAGPGKDRKVVETLRDSARRVDRARGNMRTTNPDEALETWWALVRGRWSMLDWFDSDGRRFVLGIPNPPKLGDPRGLTEREHQVATYAALGESGKMIGYRLGISKSTVSNALDGAMHKFGVKTQPQLAGKMRGFARPFNDTNENR